VRAQGLELRGLRGLRARPGQAEVEERTGAGVAREVRIGVVLVEHRRGLAVGPLRVRFRHKKDIRCKKGRLLFHT
jgi:hypothetical protein